MCEEWEGSSVSCITNISPHHNIDTKYKVRWTDVLTNRWRPGRRERDREEGERLGGRRETGRKEGDWEEGGRPGGGRETERKERDWEEGGRRDPYKEANGS